MGWKTEMESINQKPEERPKIQREVLSRGLIAVSTEDGIFLSWRLFWNEVTGYSATGLTGTNFAVLKNGTVLDVVKDSTNYIDPYGTKQDRYAVASVTRESLNGQKSLVYDTPCCEVTAFSSGTNYLTLSLNKPEGGTTPSGEEYTYSANDMSIGDVDGDGEFEFFVKWDPSNSKDVSIPGYTGNCLIDCYKLSGKLLWRLDLGINIRAGAHYTQFMVFDFDGDGKAELAVKTAPGTKVLWYGENGEICEEAYISFPDNHKEGNPPDHKENYVCCAADYREHLIQVFCAWSDRKEVKKGQWPQTLEECFGIPVQYVYPLCREDAEKLVDYFMYVYAPSRDEKNKLWEIEGFIYEGPEYLTMFGGDGRERSTISFPIERVDDGLLWGDYAMPRIEPCNRSDRFLSGVAYLDGMRPYLIIGRGYYTRTAIVAYDFFTGKFREAFRVDSGFVPMKNPFCDHPHDGTGSNPEFGILAGQGNHSLAAADVDGDGCQEIIYGAAVIDHDGSLLYSSFGTLPDGTAAKLGHGDAMHVARIDPDRKGYQIFSVFEGGTAAPYGYALRDAATGEVLFGEYADRDLGRCMIGDINPKVRGLEVWVNEVRSCKGIYLPDRLPGTNQSIRWAGDLSTQIIDGSDIFEKHAGVIQDNTHGILLIPENCAVNNGTKGNPCLVADIFGDFREELILRTRDSTALKIYTNPEYCGHKLITLMHDVMYRTGVAWQNNCYNQPCYTSFYYASDMDFEEVFLQIANH